MYHNSVKDRPICISGLEYVGHSLIGILPRRFRTVNYYQDLITFVQDRRYAIDASKIEADPGWVPEESFETGLRKTVGWYLENQTWCERVQRGSYRRERLGVDV